ncbi:MAG: MobA/MobL family protein [Clostridiales bacterium]|nr:MobA/MobL family protein [Clostridiales bacterium]
MAHYHFHVTQIKRSAGQSAIASAAYRSGERLYSEYYGEVSDYTRKGGVVCSEILLPGHAPPEYADRQTLWNAVEKAESGKKAQLAYSFDIALQNEFSLEENISLARQFLLGEFVSRGMIVDYAVHLPDKEGGIANPHFHVMCPIRPLKENGEWDAKQHREYLVDKSGAPILDDAGHRKFNAVPTTDWGSPEKLEHWRQAWAERCNARFAEKGLDVRIDHRSYERQGVVQIPTVHEGPAVRQMEKKGIETEKGSLNRFIKATNRMITATVKRLAGLCDWIATLKEELARPQSPNLAELLNNYYDQRNAGAWSQKARLSNLKSHAEAIAFLQEKGIATLEDLKEAITSANEESTARKESMQTKSKRVRELDELLRMAVYYRDNKPIYDKLNQIKFKKSREKYAAQHDQELRLFYMAQRKLKPHLSDSSKLPVTKWQDEQTRLQQEYGAEEAEYSKIYHDTRSLTVIRHCVDQAMGNEQQKQPVHRRQEHDID